jgi:hypothetical protein
VFPPQFVTVITVDSPRMLHINTKHNLAGAILKGRAGAPSM